MTALHFRTVGGMRYVLSNFENRSRGDVKGDVHIYDNTTHQSLQSRSPPVCCIECHVHKGIYFHKGLNNFLLDQLCKV